MRFTKIVFLMLINIALSFWMIYAWNWLETSTWDILTATKFNELIAKVELNTNNITSNTNNITSNTNNITSNTSSITWNTSIISGNTTGLSIINSKIDLWNDWTVTNNWWNLEFKHSWVLKVQIWSDGHILAEEYNLN